MTITQEDYKQVKITAENMIKQAEITIMINSEIIRFIKSRIK